MNILMMTNTYAPIVGGLERSVAAFAKEYRLRGHRTVVVTPAAGRHAAKEEDVIRVPALQKFNGSDFAVKLPIPGVLSALLGKFRPDIVHSHHPFLIGDTALRVSYRYHVPLVFTHHTLYEHNTHYVPGDTPALKRFVIELSTGYANLSDEVFAPGDSVLRLLRGRGVVTPIQIVPTGIYPQAFRRGDGMRFRRAWAVPKEAFVVGTVGRLAPEKNLGFLCRAVCLFLKKNPGARFVVVGMGPEEGLLRAFFSDAGLLKRVAFTGQLESRALSDAYAGMDLFAFASQSETQGVVLAEAMASGVPVAAVDACGVRDIVRDGLNGFLLPREDEAAFAAALERFLRASPMERKRLRRMAMQTADDYAMHRSVERSLRAYARLIEQRALLHRSIRGSLWHAARALIRAEWRILKNLTKATRAGMRRK